MLSHDLSQILNPAQKEAVDSYKGPFLIIAGAGTGKTRVLEYRTLELIKKGVDPSSILLLTFTRRAANEMLERTGRHDSRARHVSGGTFHSFALSILKREGRLIGFESFTVLDRGDSEDLIAKIVTDLKLRENKYFPKKNTVNDIISKSINKLTSIYEVLERDYPHLLEWEKAVELIKMKFAKYKIEKGLMDYDDLLYYFATLLEKFPHVRQRISQKFRFIMVDEYQDTNKIQAKIVNLLGREHANILIVGDEMQSIYAFRGANFENMLEFPEDFKKAKRITLEENYRSTQEILDVANAVMEEVTGPHFKKYLNSPKHGMKPQFLQFKSPKEEASFVAKKIVELTNKGVPIRQIAVLFRASYQSAPLELELTAHSIPFKKFGGIRFVETAHIKDVIAYLRVVVNPKDEISWRRILLLLDGIGEKTAELIIAQIMDGKKLEEALSVSSETQNLFKLFELLRQEKNSPSEKISLILKYYLPILKKTYDDYPQREQDLSALVDIAGGYTKTAEMLDDFAIDPPDASAKAYLSEGPEREWVCLSTIHSAKGLEWNTVFIIGVQEGRFPSLRGNTDEKEIEEERRLFYVAVTRPKERLFITSAQGKRGGFYESWYFNRPSRFVEPLINQDLVEVHGLKQFNPYRSEHFDHDSFDSDSFDETLDKF